MFTKSLLAVLITVTVMPLAAFAQDEKGIDWRKVTITCRRTRTKSKKRINGNDSRDEERSQHITIKATVKNGMKVPLQGLQLTVVGINEKASLNRKERIPVQGKEGKAISLSIEPYKKVAVEALKYTVSVRSETVGDVKNNQVNKKTTVKGATYLGYVALLRDQNDELLVVKAENKKIERIARELGIIGKDVKLDRHGVVQPPKEDKN